MPFTTGSYTNWWKKIHPLHSLLPFFPKRKNFKLLFFKIQSKPKALPRKLTFGIEISFFNKFNWKQILYVIYNLFNTRIFFHFQLLENLYFFNFRWKGNKPEFQLEHKFSTDHILFPFKFSFLCFVFYNLLRIFCAVENMKVKALLI